MAITMDFTLLLLSNMQVGFWGGGNVYVCVLVFNDCNFSYFPALTMVGDF